VNEIRKIIRECLKEIFLFENITKDSRVTIKPEYQSPGEDAMVYRAVEDRGDRVLISPLTWEFGNIVPTELVKKDMLEIYNEINEDFRYRYDGKFEPNEQMIKNAKDALVAINKNDLTKEDYDENEGSGKSKAESIKNKESFNHSQLKRMKAFFDKNESAYKSAKNQGKSLNDSGIIQRWNLWGGDAGKSWCEEKIKQRNSSNDTSKTVRGASGIRTKRMMDPNNTRIHK
jgi:hypothetical protein